MQPEAKDAAHLWDMLDAARAVQEFVASRSFSRFHSAECGSWANEVVFELLRERQSRLQYRRRWSGSS
jgi:uncharacterized protein with HEPN domain